jgi:hypothetical protein
MGRAHRLAVSGCLLLALVPPALAQGPPTDTPLPLDDGYVALTPAQDRELDDWLSAMKKWQRYDAQWHNRPVRSPWGGFAERWQPPVPPTWLEARCMAAAAAAAQATRYDERTVKACRLIADPRAGDDVPSPEQAARAKAEKPPKHSSFLSRVHIDGLWSTASTGGRFYGIVGSHLSLVDVGRVQIFGPPGVMLLSVPDGEGSRRLTLAYTWGVSLRLADVRLFAPTRNMTLFFNVSKAWADAGEAGGNVRSFDIVGFSLAPRRKH